MTYGIKTQKQKLEALKTELTAIYFKGSQRILTYGGVNYLDATIKLMDFQRYENTPITMIVIEGELPVGETSNDIQDYQKYLDIEVKEVVA